MTNKHYIKIDSNGLITEAFSDTFRTPDNDCICINEQGGRHFQINGVINPSLVDADGFFVFKWNGTEIVNATKEEQPEKLAELARQEFKQQREVALRNLTVTTAAGNTFDADEVSQQRLARVIQAGVDTVEWILADNSKVVVSQQELQEALSLAVESQITLWIQG